MRDDSMMAHITNLPNWFTSASVFCGLYAITLAADTVPGDTEGFFKAAIAIVFAGLFDTLDGRVARMTNSSTEFGIQYDSLADVVSFGVAPAFLLYRWGLVELGAFGLIGAFLFLVAGAMRLARFNIMTRKLSNKWSQGLTITEAGGLVAAIVILHHRLEYSAPAGSWMVFALALLLSFLMVSNIRFRTFKQLKVNPRSLTFLALGAVACAGAVLLYQDPVVLLVLLPVAHISSGLVEEVIFFRQRRLEDQEALMVEKLPAGQGGVGAAFESDDEDES